MSISTYAIPKTEGDAHAPRLEIAQLLRSVEKKKSLMKIYVRQRAVAISAIILDVDIKNNAIILDNSCDSELKNFHEKEDAAYEITLRSARILFSSQEVSPCEHDKRPALRLNLPPSVAQVQRREFYRLDVPVNDPPICHITLPTGSAAPSVSLPVKDISIGGLALVDNQRRLGDSTGAVYASCQLELPGTGMLPVKLQVMRFMNEALAFEQESRHVGCKFIDLHASTEFRLQNYINSLERAINAKRHGFD
ncbi:MAG: flagellar regulator YcgR PilZN domain-containing protein [Burkholderiaceae bacterium]